MLEKQSQINIRLSQYRSCFHRKKFEVLLRFYWDTLYKGVLQNLAVVWGAYPEPLVLIS